MVQYEETLNVKNVTGSPAGTINNYGWSLGNLSGLTAPLIASSTDIGTVSGVTRHSRTHPNYTFRTGIVGVIPTVTKNGTQAITAITAPGTPITYATPTVGTLTLGGGPGG